MPNITIKIDDEKLILQAKVMAAKKGTSLSALLRQYLEDLVAKDEEYERAKRTALQDIKQGLNLGGTALPREEIYDGRLG